MNPIADQIAKIERVILAIPAIIRESVAMESEFVEDLNREQLERGERVDGSSLPDYSPVSVEVYGKPEGAMTLFDTGDFYEGITTVIEDDFLDIEGKDSKTNMLINEYGNILGLQEKSIEKLREKILPTVIEKIKQLL